MKDPQKDIKEAVALQYSPDAHSAPVVKAKGKGDTARRIIEEAKKANVPIQQDPDLAALLGRLDINEAIPEELYAAVAEVFTMIYRLDQSLKNKDIK
ncbi:EscU/YscU/HrcU family type III secretion system export apparatus switch protein [Heyndrickxia coagulans]|uniref:EscU/YscU/HrcU family type III secretion system export apparatus switch protein n=1 Tax=Heyndrickxia coagulans TaxID=1398 RepID=UPI002E1B2EF0|nr:EscU/YscU/HrcU family type III secretion system export apparatus switch protein [Heyndrickxia coagulans]MED4934546.1 EscU/YscU/HrcU family type III secretion system export apparatus switch protein [Heyndrickxia coagulans]